MGPAQKTAHCPTWCAQALPTGSAPRAGAAPSAVVCAAALQGTWPLKAFLIQVRVVVRAEYTEERDAQQLLDDSSHLSAVCAQSILIHA